MQKLIKINCDKYATDLNKLNDIKIFIKYIQLTE